MREGAPPNDHEYAWSFNSSLVVANRTVYCGCDNGLVAADATSGREGWRLGDTDIGDVVRSSSAVSDGAVYVSSSDGCLNAIDA